MKVTDEQALADIADLLYLEPADLDHEADLRDQGMDSVRVMELVERWRSAGLPQIDYIALAEDQRVTHWLTVLRELQQA
ncbi:phosphopantetheine-binding protein [Micromonospora craniellae]|uniref:Acyl carrier protein n=1 Tax=Micromonospora craniellae TaxID=2294034 RepID=A0A372FS73_9ACTN|nr:phosphopantetheine-binding protein [Micromonospora craniellae]QOC94752.1 acyl carrier protein [Micromonospora craniellae]RFS43558.1 acyl carrier protein [Micromonospora craniellae]